jgi:hypothetical protein
MRSQKQRLNVPLFALAALVLTSLACSFVTRALGISSSQQEEVQPQQPAPFLESILPRGDCDHPYFPVSQGATWHYETTGNPSSTYTHSILSVGDSGFVDQYAFDSSGTTTSNQWKCEDGNLTTLTPSVAADGETFTFTITSNSGVTIPADLRIGSSWSQELTYEQTGEVSGVEINNMNQMTTTCTATGRESVTVPAGTFEALRLECNSKITITIAGIDPIVIDTSSVAWYAEEVGMVKTVSTASGVESSTVLLAYQIP